MNKQIEALCMWTLFVAGLYKGFNQEYLQATYAISCACFIKIGIKP